MAGKPPAKCERKKTLQMEVFQVRCCVPLHQRCWKMAHRSKSARFVLYQDEDVSGVQSLLFPVIEAEESDLSCLLGSGSCHLVLPLSRGSTAKFHTPDVKSSKTMVRPGNQFFSCFLHTYKGGPKNEGL